MSLETFVGTALKNVNVSTTPILVTGAGLNFAANDLARANRAIITCYTNPVNVSYASGVAPTATLGIALATGASLTVLGNANINNLQFIRQGAADGVISVLLEE